MLNFVRKHSIRHKKAAIKAAFVYAGNGVAYIMVASGKDFKFFFYLNT